MEEFNDDLHRLILHRLGERKEKLDKIEEWIYRNGKYGCSG